MRILVVNHHRGLVGGLETYLRDLIPALSRAGHEVALFYRVEAADPATAIDSEGGCSAAWRGGEENEALPAELALWKPDIVYLHQPPSARAHANLVERFPVVMFAHDYHGLCATGRKMQAFPRPSPCARRCGPACLVLHYPRRCGGLSPLTMIRNYRKQMSHQELLGKHRAIAVASEHMRREFLRHGVEPDRVHVVSLPPSGVAADPAPPARQGPRDRLLFVGRLTDLKGVDYLLRALAPAERLLGRPLRLRVAGSGPDDARLRSLAQQLRIDVEFTGWVDTPGRMRQMRENDLLVAPSIWPEPFGLVGIEAGCVGLPAAAYDVGGITEWLRPGVSGEIAPGDPPSVKGLAEAIARALADAGHYLNLSRGAWEVARQFTLANHLQTLLPMLERAAHQDGCLTTC